jgi:putative transposase
MTRPLYSTDVTDTAWQDLAPHLPSPKLGGRPRVHPVREILHAIFYGLRSGGAGRLLPHDFPPGRTVYHYVRLWRVQGLWATLHTWRRAAVRVQAGREPQPSAAMLDSPSVKTTTVRGPRGYDGGKKGNGRKRHLLVDTQGLLLRAGVHPADIADRDGARLGLASSQDCCPPVRQVWVDRGSRGEVIEWMTTQLGWTVEVVKRPSKWGRSPIDVEPSPLPAFPILPRRWVVERPFAWWVAYRRLAKDDEELPATSEAFLYLAMARLMVRRLAH